MRAALPALALLVSGGAAPAPAHAQAYQCRIPQDTVSAPEIARDGSERRGPITGYTLALGWSPEFCRGREKQADDQMQCSGRNGRFGLIVHGLWPEGKPELWPQWCSAARVPGAATLRKHLCMMPSPRLMAHEWAKHGSCMVGTPETYFHITAILWDSLRLPDLDRLSRRKNLDSGTIRRAFADANPAFTPDMIGIKRSGQGWLEDIRLCYNTGFMPAQCTKAQYGPRDAAPIAIWRGL